MSGTVVSLNVGQPQAFLYQSRSILSAMFKNPVEVPLQVGKLGFPEDTQVDQQHHGGIDKALCVYPREHYGYWRERHGLEVTIGGFGENLTTEGLLESEVCIGDVFRVGEAVVEVSQPRQPCYKLAVHYDMPEMTAWFQQTGFTGYYLRCLLPGSIAAGDVFNLIEPSLHAVTVAEANRLMHHDRDDVEGIRRLLANPQLSASWRLALERRLMKHHKETPSQLNGDM